MNRERASSCLTGLVKVLLGICLVPIAFIVAFSLIVSFATALFKAFFGLFFSDEGVFSIFWNTFSDMMWRMLYMDDVMEFLANVLDVLKWGGLGIVGICLALPALCFLGGVLAGLFWIYWAAWGSDKEEVAPRVISGVRVGYFHWTGRWFSDWAATLLEALDECWQFQLNHSGKWAPLFVWPFVVGGWLSCGLIACAEFVVRLAAVMLLWLLRNVAAAWLRSWSRAFRMVRECRDCHAWTTVPVWRCPKCGQAHQELAPSAKFGLFWWDCECGTRLPTLGVLGRYQLTEVCPECGGKLEGVGRAPAGMAFFGAADLGLSRLAREVDGIQEGNRQLRIYDVADYSLEQGDFLEQRYWGHVGTVVFALDPSDLAKADLVWERWQLFMERRYPRRTRQMACAVMLGPSADFGLSASAGDDECRALLASLDIGRNLLNGLEHTFRRVRFFPWLAEDATSDTLLRDWVVREAFEASLPAEARPPGVCFGMFRGRWQIAFQLLLLTCLAVSGLYVWQEWRDFGSLFWHGDELVSQAEFWMNKAGSIDASDWRRMAEEQTGSLRPTSPRSSEGSHMPTLLETALADEREKAYEALSSLEGFDPGANDPVSAWAQLQRTVADAILRVKSAQDEGWAGRKTLRKAEQRLYDVLRAGEVAMAWRAEWVAARSRLAEAAKAEKEY